MSYRRVIQLRKLKDKLSKRYFVKIRFYHRNIFLFEERFDINEFITDNEIKSISFGETIKLFKYLLDIESGQYPIEKKENTIWCVKEVDGYSISLRDEDLAKLRQNRLQKLGI
jgi:hypothetical protein